MVRYCIIELSDLQGENEMKKFVSLALALCMGLAVLAGCSSETENSSSESSASSKAETSESLVSTGENSDTDYESSDASDENSDANEIINNLENPYASGFPANPSYYPPEEYGQPITTGDFGEDLKELNEELSRDEGQEVYAYLPPDSEYLQIHFSPSDKAIEEKDDQTVALEYTAMALLIAENYPYYSDTYGDTIAIYLGDLTALISVSYVNSTPYTSLMVFSQDTSLAQYLNLAYDTTLGKYDTGLLTD